MNEPTVRDLLARAKTANDEPERTAALDAAWQLADRGTRYPSSDWRAILEVLVDHGTGAERIRACSQKVIAAAGIELDTWGFSEAIVALYRIGAEAESRDALALATTALETRSKRAYEWGLQAQGISHVEAYGPEVRALLARGAEIATQRGDFDALAGLANHVFKLVKDRALALQLQQQAEAIWRARTGGEFRDVWCVANGWHAIGGLAERDSVLAEARGHAATVDDFLILARILKSHDDPRAAGAIADALPLAKTAKDWYDIADAAHACDADAELISKALLECRAHQPSKELLAKVDQSAHSWLGVHRDHVASVRPEDLRPRRRLVVGWPSSSSGLFDWLCERMTDARIELVAKADYGMDFGGHRDAIATIVTDRVVPPTLPWIPGEVIELTRWSTGDRVDHTARAFCAALLLIYGGEGATNASIVIESVFALDPAALPLAIALLVDVYERSEPSEPIVLYAAALVASRAGRSPERIAALLELCATDLRRDADRSSFDLAAALCAALHRVISVPAWKAVSLAVAADGRVPALAALATAVAAAL